MADEQGYNTGCRWPCYTAVDQRRQLSRLRDLGLLDGTIKAALGRWRARQEHRAWLRDQRNQPTLDQRLAARIEAVMVPEIEARGGEIEIAGRDESAPVRLADREAGCYLLRAEGWRAYSRAYGNRLASLAYLCGWQGRGRNRRPWAVRVPGTCRTVAEALDALEPAAVKRARDEGRRVWRQGDAYLIERRDSRDNLSALPPRHRWCPDRRALYHPEHRRLVVGRAHVTACAQTALGMGRGGGRGCGDR